MPETAASIAEVSAPITPKPEVKVPVAAPPAESPASEDAKDLLTGVADETPKPESDSEKAVEGAKAVEESREIPKEEEEKAPGETDTEPKESTTEAADDKEGSETEGLSASEDSSDSDEAEESRDKKRRTQALIKHLEKFQDKYPRLGLREIARVETGESREARVRKTIYGLTNKESYDELLAELKIVHPELDPVTLDKQLKKNLTSTILKKSSRKDLKIIEGMLKDPDSYPEMRRIQGNLESMLPAEMKSRNTKKVKKALGVLILGLVADLVGQASKET